MAKKTVHAVIDTQVTMELVVDDTLTNREIEELALKVLIQNYNVSDTLIAQHPSLTSAIVIDEGEAEVFLDHGWDEE